MKLRIFGLALLLGAALESGLARGADDDPAPIRSRAQEIVKALSAGDADAVAACWTPSGEYVHESTTIRGRENIRKAYAEHFKKKPAGEIAILDDAVRFLSDAVAVQEGNFVVQRDNPADSVRSKFSILYIKSDGKWYVGMLREEPDGASLEELAWLVGNWTFKTDKSEGTMSVEFTMKKTYLMIKTKVQDGKDELTATQILAIDPATHTLKSWTFESDGGIGTAEWVRTKTGWQANITATTEDGDPVKAVTTLTPSGRDVFVFKTTDRTVDGEKVPDIGPVTVTRTASR